MYASCLSSRDVTMSHPMSWSWVVRSSRRSIVLEFSFLLVVMLAGVLRASRRDKDGDWINVHLKCTLDREDYVSWRFPFVLPYAWISGRDSCLVGVSCHILASPCIRVLHHVYLSSEIWNGEDRTPRTLWIQLGFTKNIFSKSKWLSKMFIIYGKYCKQ